MVQDEAEDAGLLAQVKDDNDVMRQPQRRTCLDICLDCYKYADFLTKSLYHKHGEMAIMMKTLSFIFFGFCV